MAKVEIHLEDGETLEEAEELLLKALSHHRSGAEHKETFHQPSARDVFSKMISLHDREWNRMLKQINKVIDQDAK